MINIIIWVSCIKSVGQKNQNQKDNEFMQYKSKILAVLQSSNCTFWAGNFLKMLQSTRKKSSQILRKTAVWSTLTLS